MSDEARKLDVIEREQAIFRYLRSIDHNAGATVRQIHRHLTSIGVRLTVDAPIILDSVTVQAYHKLITRLLVDGRMIEIGSPDSEGQRYTLAPALHADTALRLDDIHEALAEMAPTEALAALIDIRESLRKKKKDLLYCAAVALRRVPPREFIHDMIVTKAAAYNADVDVWQEHDGADERHRRRLKMNRMEMENICYRWFGLSKRAVYVPPSTAVATGDHARMRIVVDEDRLAHQLVYRVFGDTFVQHVPVHNPSAPADWTNVVVAGSDGSTYSSVMQLDTASAFIDAGGAEIVTFNNSIVYLHLEGENRRRHPSPMYSVPITRSAIDSPHNSGMVMAPFMYRNDGLKDSEYEHMAKCATDVVQWRADERVFLGDAPALGGDGRVLPAPRVHLRDGTVTLQERELNHYQRNDPYGDMVRAGVRLSDCILRHITTRRQPPVFAGAVKSSQLRLFATLVSWFIANGHLGSGIAPIDSSWDVSRGALLADNEVITMLLGTLVSERDDGYFCTFVVARPFHATTDLHRQYDDDRPDFWTEKIRGRQRDHMANPDSDSYWVTVDAVEDDPFVRMCERADYAMFYIGHTAGDPAPVAPRYEFLESLRTLPPDDAAQRVRRNIELMVAALDHTKFTEDLDHNFLTGKKLVKIVPKVIYTAHEYCKALGRRLESELKSMVVANLVRLGLARRTADETIRLRPLGTRAFLDRQQQVEVWDRRQIEGSDELK